MNFTTKVKKYIVKVIKIKEKERKLKAKEAMEEVFELEKENNSTAGFDYPRIFFLTKVVDDSLTFSSSST
ncbi:hypothetical protein Glove_259g31 [Diversispora epigaea]|uniref:Uncharacterized protein n=1 Tax=Diversispora epigaea TaxID=1348612 RepID=A0A397IDA9_9GLOM|nr:hypothetical protein Glove_259g31 [Diversispora epigaea]